MNCPYCDFTFKLALTNATSSEQLRGIIPAVCQNCAEVSLVIAGQIRQITRSELQALKHSQAWKNAIAPARRVIFAHMRANAAHAN